MKKTPVIILILVVLIVVLFVVFRGDEFSDMSRLGLVSSEKNISLEYPALFTDKRVAETEARILDFKSNLGTEGNNDYNTYIDIAGLESTLGHGNEVLINLGKAIEIDPKNIVAYANAGTMFERISAFKSAESVFRKTLEIEPNSVYAHSMLIDLHKSYLNSPDETIDGLFKDALVATRDDLQIMKDYASWLGGNGDDEDLEPALLLWQKILELEPDQVYKDLIFEEISLLSDRIKANLVR